MKCIRVLASADSGASDFARQPTAGAVNKKVKALQLMKNLYSVQDPCFVAAVQAHSTPFISELLEYRCVPHPQYGDKPMLRVRKLARCAS